MITKKSFVNIFNPCYLVGKGWKNINIRVNHPLVWKNENELKITTFCEGDLIEQECENINEFNEEINRIISFDY